MTTTSARVWQLALASGLIGTLLIWISTALDATWTVVVATLGTVVVTLGVGNLVSDLFLQKTLISDLMALLKSDRRLLEAGIEGLDLVEDLEWAELIRSDKQLDCLILDVEQFKSVLWTRILDASRADLTHINIAFVDVGALTDEASVNDAVPVPAVEGVESPASHQDSAVETAATGATLDDPVRDAREHRLIEVATRMGTTPDSYRRAVSEVMNKVEEDWKAHKDDSGTSCTLTLRRSSFAPRHAYVSTSRRAALILEPLVPKGSRIGARALAFKLKDKNNSYADWLTESLRASERELSSPIYTDADASNTDDGSL